MIASIEPIRPRRSSSAPTSCGITATSTGRAVITSRPSRSVRHSFANTPMIWRSWTSTPHRSTTFPSCSARRASEERTRTLAESTALRERLVAATPADDPRRESFLSNLGSCYGNLGTAHLDEGALDEAIAWTRKALAIQDEQIKKRPNSVDYLERVGANHIAARSARVPDRSSRDRANRARAGASLPRASEARPTRRRGFPDAPGSLPRLTRRCGDRKRLDRAGLESGSTRGERGRGDPPDQPQVSSASHGLAGQLLRDAEISWEHRRIRSCPRESGSRGSDPSPTGRVLPRIARYRSDLATTIRVHVRMDSEIGRDHDDEPRLREAMALTESAPARRSAPRHELSRHRRRVFRPGDHAWPARST